MATTLDLSRFERFAIAVGRALNETDSGKRIQTAFLRKVSFAWVSAALAPRMFVVGLNELAQLAPERGVMIVSNHRSFFDLYAISAAIWMGSVPWAKRLYFPVRSNFFYERPAGILVNLLIGGGSMYPPVFRQLERSALNKLTVDKVCAFLQRPGVVVGMHPEGTRNKGEDLYGMLPAQPGVGTLALKARPLVVPVFIQGLTNDLRFELRARRVPDIRRNNPCITVFGKPMEYADLLKETPRPSLYKKFADRSRDEILALGGVARQIADQCRQGEIDDQDIGWMSNRLASGRKQAGNQTALSDMIHIRGS